MILLRDRMTLPPPSLNRSIAGNSDPDKSAAEATEVRGDGCEPIAAAAAGSSGMPCYL
ncbi:MAG: hypothetical protein Fues2KO_16420 [Fuerstiella sp.]